MLLRERNCYFMHVLAYFATWIALRLIPKYLASLMSLIATVGIEYQIFIAAEP